MTETLRDEVARAFGATPISATGETHAGLYFDRYAPPTDAGRDAAVKARTDFIDNLARIGVPQMYPRAFERWKRVLVESGAIVAEVSAFERLLVGHGNPSGLEVGLTLHKTYGVPYLPGTALKGVLNHYLATWGQYEEGGAAWRGVKYVGGAPAEPPGAFHKALFGAPAIPALDAGSRGGVRFEDALYIHGSVERDEVLTPDVVTPHQDQYYKKYGANDAWANEWDEPVPVGFVSVRPGARFLLAVSGPKEAAALAMAHLLDALETHGVGAKTRAGYGRLERYVAEKETKRTDAATSAPTSPPGAVTGLARLLQTLAALEQTDPKRTRIDRFAEAFATLDGFDGLARDERREALAAFEKLAKYGVIRDHLLTPAMRKKLGG